jgi:HlyD family secretion protein
MSAAGVAALAAALILLPGWLRPSIARERLRTARVERGTVAAEITATGTVVPAAELSASSPFEGRVVAVRRRAGAVVAAGDELVELDAAAFEVERGRLEAQMAQLANEKEQLGLALDRSLIDLAGQLEVKRLDADLLTARAEQSRRLSADGLLPAVALRVAEVEAQKAAIEVRHLAATEAATRRSTAAQLAALDLQRNGRRAELAEVDRQIAMAAVRADRAGVVAWIVPEAGVTAHRGDVLARIADLGSFRVEASVSDVHSAHLVPGLPARVVVDGQEIPGRLAAVNPTIEDGAVKFTVDLADRRDPRLRANLRVDVLVETARRGGTLRLRSGPFLASAGSAGAGGAAGSAGSAGAGESGGAGGADRVFVVRGGEAVRRDVRLGLLGADYCEVESGLAAGDEVVISDMKDYLHLQRVKLD